MSPRHLGRVRWRLLDRYVRLQCDPVPTLQSVPPTEPEGEFISRLQALMGAAGVVPFSGSPLTGSCGPATTVAIEDDEGNIVAAAHGYMPHNTFSPLSSLRVGRAGDCVGYAPRNWPGELHQREHDRQRFLQARRDAHL